MGQSTPLKHGTRPPEAPNALEWAEIAGLVDIRPDGSWQMTDFAKEWLSNHPPAPVPPVDDDFPARGFSNYQRPQHARAPVARSVPQ